MATGRRRRRLAGSRQVGGRFVGCRASSDPSMSMDNVAASSSSSAPVGMNGDSEEVAKAKANGLHDTGASKVWATNMDLTTMLPDNFDELDEVEQERMFKWTLDQARQQAHRVGNPLIIRGLEDMSPKEREEYEEALRAKAEYLGIVVGDRRVEYIELTTDPNLMNDPEEQYISDKKSMQISYEMGDIHCLETVCNSLLDRKPEDTEVWRMLTISRIRLKMYDEAVESARRWIAFDPYSVSARTSEAMSLACAQRYDEARALFAQLSVEAQSLDINVAKEMQECIWRIDELWMDDNVVGNCQLSARPETVVLGVRPPHMYLPDFADSIGPIEVQHCTPDDEGGGSSHYRKLVCTKPVKTGELLFVQSALVFGKVDRESHVDRLADALVTMATTSPRTAEVLDTLTDDLPLLEGEDVASKLLDPRATRAAGPWGKDADSMVDNLELCKKVVGRSKMFTGKHWVGVWPLPALARHSCVPNTAFMCMGDTMVARAARDLEAGDEITFAFFDVCRPLEARVEVAEENPFGWLCTCERCELESSATPSVKKADAALEKLNLAFKKMESRINGIYAEVQMKMFRREKANQREFEEFTAEERPDIEENQFGLGDKYIDRDGRSGLSKEEMEELGKMLPPAVEPQMAYVPESLVDEALGAIVEFMDQLENSGLSQKHKHWYTASAKAHFQNTVLLFFLKKDLVSQLQLVRTLLPALAETQPGCFDHESIQVAEWEIAALLEDPKIGEMNAGELAPEVQAKVSEVLKIRYGHDMSPAEEAGVQARLAYSRNQIDENWMWEALWAIGEGPPRWEMERDGEFTDEMEGVTEKDALLATQGSERTSMW